ncbi:MAG: universal stress protein [Actinomycetota bacterium]
MERIVVGVDRSASAQRALRWALRHAADDDIVTAGHVWQAHRGSRLQVLSMAEIQRERPRGEAMVRGLVDEVVAELGGVSAAIEVVAYYGQPRLWLVEMSEQADLLIVGRRGEGGFPGLHLGSVSSYVTHHAHCPVVVVRDGDEHGDDAEPR